MNSARKMCFAGLALVLLFSLFPFSQAHAASIDNGQETLSYVEDLGNGITVETTIEVLPSFARNYSTSAIAVSNYKNNGNWIATVSLKAYFTYNHITAGVTGTEYSKSLASGWCYTNHKITTTTVSSSNGGTATLTANLKDFPLNVAVRLSLHCSPDGYITKG